MKPHLAGHPNCGGSGRVRSGGFQNLACRVGSGQNIFRISRVGSGRVRRFSKSRGSDRVGSRRLDILAGRVGSGQDVSKFSRVGSDQLTRPEPTRPARFDPTREKAWLIRALSTIRRESTREEIARFFSRSKLKTNARIVVGWEQMSLLTNDPESTSINSSAVGREHEKEKVQK